VLVRSSKLRETFDKACKASFVEEAQTLARFDHPSLVRVLRRWEAQRHGLHGHAAVRRRITLREHIRALPERPTKPG
jgi:hypothetical protein